MLVLPFLEVFGMNLEYVIHEQRQFAVGLRCHAKIAFELLFRWIVEFRVHFQITRQDEGFVAHCARERLMRDLIVFFQSFFRIESLRAQLAFYDAAVKLHVSLEMIFRCHFFMADLANMSCNLNSVKTRVSCKELLVDEALIAFVVWTFERFITSVSGH